MNEEQLMDDRQREISQILHRAWPVTEDDWVTREELTDKLAAAEKVVDLKISCSAERLRNWVLLGCLAIIMTFGGGYVSLVSKLDRLNEALPEMIAVQDGRRPWNLYQDQRLDKVDETMRRLDPQYRGMPYVEPPK